MKFFRSAITCGLFLPAFVALAANPPTNSAPAKVVAGKSALHCLWEVKGASNTVFLLGSMHVMKPEMYPLAAEIEAAYQKSSVVVFETDLKAMESPELALKLMSKATYPEGETLKQHVSPALYSLLVSNLQSAGLPEEALAQYKPWMAAMTLVLTDLQQQGFDLENGVDRHFHERAAKDNKREDYFEPPEFQINLLGNLSDKESEESLGQSLREMADWRKEFADLVAAWQSGDTAALDKLLLKSFREYPSIHKSFLLDRNQAWVGKIENWLKGDKDVFVVVGAGHLVGKGSVVDLLQAKGLTVKQR